MNEPNTLLLSHLLWRMTQENNKINCPLSRATVASKPQQFTVITSFYISCIVRMYVSCPSKSASHFDVI